MDNIGLYTHTNVGAKSQMQNGDKENAEKHSWYTILVLCKNVTKIDNIDVLIFKHSWISYTYLILTSLTVEDVTLYEDSLHDINP